MTRRKRLLLISLSGVGILAAFAIGFCMGLRCYPLISQWRYQKRFEARKERLVGKLAPDVVTTTAAGAQWRLRDHQDKVILVDFWAAWCGPCIQAVPYLRNIYSEFENDPNFLMVGVSLDWNSEELIAYCEKKGIRWLQLIEPGSRQNSFARAFEVYGIPDICLVDREGKVSAIRLRAESEEEQESLIQKIKSLLGSGSNEAHEGVEDD